MTTNAARERVRLNNKQRYWEKYHEDNTEFFRHVFRRGTPPLSESLFQTWNYELSKIYLQMITDED